MKLRTTVLICAGAWLLAGSALRAADRWVRVSTPQFTILTADSVPEARSWAVALQATCREMQTLTHVDAGSLDPLTIVVFGDQKSFMRVLGPQQTKNGLYERTVGRTYLHNGRVFSAVNPDEPDIARRSAFLDAMQWLTGSFRRPLPLWISSGLQEVFSNYAVEHGRVTIGWTPQQAGMSGDPWYSFETMLWMKPSYPSYQREGGAERFNGEACLLVHFLMIGEHGEDRAAFQQFLDGLGQGMSQENALVKAFPEGMAALAKRFERYARDGDFRTMALASDAAELEKGLRVRPATEAEVQIALGYVVIGGQGADLAAPYFARAVELAPDAPETLEAQADLALTRGDRATAIDYYRRAVKAGSKFYLAHYYPEMEKVQSMIGGEAAADRCDGAEVRATVDALKETVRLSPGFYEAYRSLAGLIAALTEVNTDDGALLAEGLERYPTQAFMQAGQAAYEIKAGHYASAKQRLDRILNGEFEGGPVAIQYARKIELHFAAQVNLGWAEKFYKEGKYDQSANMMGQLDSAPLLPAEFQRKRALGMKLSAWQNLTLAQAAIEKKDWAEADSLLAGMSTQDLPEPIKAEATKVTAQLAAAKKAAGL